MYHFPPKDQHVDIVCRGQQTLMWLWSPFSFVWGGGFPALFFVITKCRHSMAILLHGTEIETEIAT